MVSFSFLSIVVFVALYLSVDVFGLTVPVQIFTPKPIHITVDDLPPPYQTISIRKPSIVIPIPDNATLFVPDKNFRVSIYRDKLIRPRQMIYTPTDDILVTEMTGNRICILSDDTTSIFADASNGIFRAFGMAFVEDWFYVANAGDLRRYPYRSGDRKIEGLGEILLTYESSHHWTRSLIISPQQDQLFVTVGSGSNVDIEYPSRASVQMANLDGSNNQTFAWGLRNPVGIDFHPITGDLYVAVQERDELGDELVPDFFTRIKKDEFYGWPFAYLSPNHVDPRRRFTNGSSERSDLVKMTRTPDVLFESHSAVLGMIFYRGKQFPIQYRNGAFAAFHGSWNRQTGTGFNLIYIPFNNDQRPKGYYEEFLTGFLVDPVGPRTFGRPVGILEMKDGSLLISEDGNGRLYRVEYISPIESTAMFRISSASKLTFSVIGLIMFSIFLINFN